MSNVRCHMNQWAIASVAVAAFTAWSNAAACKGSVPTELSFENGSAALPPTERAKVERALQEAKRGLSYGTVQVALAVHAGEAELGSLAEGYALTTQREASVKELLSAVGVPASSIVVHTESAREGPLMNWKQGTAELEFTFACKGMWL